MIHTFGDSHAGHGWQWMEANHNIPVKMHVLGPLTCSSFGLHKYDVVNNGFEVNEDDIVCFCFGEIDCRTHLCKPQNFKIYKELVNEIVSRYFEAIMLNVNRYKNLTTLVYSVTPTIKAKTIVQNPEFPHAGSDEERKEVTLYMNLKLKEYCEKYNYIFLDVYDKYCDEEGFLNMKLSDGAVHTGDPIYIKEKLESLNLLTSKKEIHNT